MLCETKGAQADRTDVSKVQCQSTRNPLSVRPGPCDMLDPGQGHGAKLGQWGWRGQALSTYSH